MWLTKNLLQFNELRIHAFGGLTCFRHPHPPFWIIINVLKHQALHYYKRYHEGEKLGGTLSRWIGKDGKNSETIINCLSKVSPGCLAATLRTLLSFLSFPDLGQLFLLCAWHVITTLICVVSLSLSPPYFFFSPSALPLFSLTLWKPKELVRAWLTLLFLLLLHHVICVTCLRFCLFLSWCLWAHS